MSVMQDVEQTWRFVGQSRCSLGRLVNLAGIDVHSVTKLADEFVVLTVSQQ